MLFYRKARVDGVANKVDVRTSIFSTPSGTIKCLTEASWIRGHSAWKPGPAELNNRPVTFMDDQNYFGRFVNFDQIDKKSTRIIKIDGFVVKKLLKSLI